MNVIHATPVLADKTSTGKKKFWQGFVVRDDTGKAFTYSEFWQEGSARQRSALTAVEGKNTGKKNATTSEQQAIADIESDRRRKEKKGYVAEGQESTRVLPLPMLAHSYEKRRHDIKWPCHAQPKLDGIRCLTDGVQFWSREGNLFPEVAVQHLRGDTRGLVLDGELMLDPEQYSFEQTVSAVKDASPDAEKGLLQSKLQYYVFDVLMPEPWVERLSRLRGLFADMRRPKGWVLVPTHQLDSELAVQAFLDTCLEQGHEGIILRNIQGEYKLKHRSKDLQKHKPFVDEEYPIAGVEEGAGKDAGTPIFQCTTADGKVFSVRPKGSLAWRQRLWAERTKLTGKRITVTYQNLTSDGVPRFPVGKGLRDYE